MRNLKLFTHLALLISTPTFLLHPQNNFPHIEFSPVNYGYQQETERWIRPTTYDEIMQLLEDLESGELERTYSPMQLELINDYLATLAKEGILPDEFEEDEILEEDIHDLMHGEDNAFELKHYLENGTEYMIIPAVLNGYPGYNIVQCGKISNAWKKTKKFVKKHKKAIIIGAVVVVAVTVVAVAVVAASSASAASAASAAGVAAGTCSKSSESKSSESNEEPPQIFDSPKEDSAADASEAPLLREAIDEQIAGFKEFLVEDKIAQQTTSSIECDLISFTEKAREVGAILTHEAFDAINELVKVVPQLFEEVKELGTELLPDSFFTPEIGIIGSPIENFDNIFTKGHEAIDKVFSTDQAKHYTEEAKERSLNSKFALGVLPPPGVIFKNFSDTGQFVRGGKVFDRAGYTKAGRSLMKHGYREGSVFPRPLGNPTQVNAHGQQILESIINHPERVIYERPHPDFEKVIEIVVPDKWGVRFTMEGEMIGFLEP